MDLVETKLMKVADENYDEIDSLKRELEIANYKLNLVEGKL